MHRLGLKLPLTSLLFTCTYVYNTSQFYLCIHLIYMKHSLINAGVVRQCANKGKTFSCSYPTSEDINGAEKNIFQGSWVRCACIWDCCEKNKSFEPEKSKFNSPHENLSIFQPHLQVVMWSLFIARFVFMLACK